MAVPGSTCRESWTPETARRWLPTAPAPCSVPTPRRDGGIRESLMAIEARPVACHGFDVGSAGKGRPLSTSSAIFSRMRAMHVSKADALSLPCTHRATLSSSRRAYPGECLSSTLVSPDGSDAVGSDGKGWPLLRSAAIFSRMHVMNVLYTDAPSRSCANRAMPCSSNAAYSGEYWRGVDEFMVNPTIMLPCLSKAHFGIFDDPRSGEDSETGAVKGRR